jgi:hypothetical protein
MINHLHQIPIGIQTVKTTGAIAMSARLGLDCNAILEQKSMPGIDVVYAVNDKA